MTLRLLGIFAGALTLLIVGLRTFDPPRGNPPPPAATPAPSSRPAAAPTAVGTTPRPSPIAITSVSPETIEVRGGRATGSSYRIAYTIGTPEKVESAEFTVYAPEDRRLFRQPVPVEASGVLDVTLDFSDFDVGPHVRLRAVCPTGTTEWVSLNGERLEKDVSVTVPRLTSASGKFSYLIDHENPGAGRFHMFGQNLTADCTAEGESNGRRIELLNVYFRAGFLIGLINRTELGLRQVRPRYLEFKISIDGPGVAYEAIKRMPFSE